MDGEDAGSSPAAASFNPPRRALSPIRLRLDPAPLPQNSVARPQLDIKHGLARPPSLRELRRARRLIVSDPEIMGGDPVFRGTRVLVHMIAELVAQGSTQAELIEAYPRLTAEMIRLAPVYAAAYPLRGPRRKQPWRDQQPVRRGRRVSSTPSRCREIPDRQLTFRRYGEISS
jgi:uncharacterized protein (DUF433 family)